MFHGMRKESERAEWSAEIHRVADVDPIAKHLSPITTDYENAKLAILQPGRLPYFNP